MLYIYNFYKENYLYFLLIRTSKINKYCIIYHYKFFTKSEISLILFIFLIEDLA